MDTLQKVIGARAKIRRNLQQKSSALSLYRRNEEEVAPSTSPVEPALLEAAVKEVALIDQFQNDLKACNKLVDTLVAVVLNEMTGFLYRGMGLYPTMGFGTGKLLDSDLSNASAMRTALTNVGANFLGTTANVTLLSSEPTTNAAKALKACTDAVLNDSKYNALAEDSEFLYLMEGVERLIPGSGAGTILTLLNDWNTERELADATPELKESFNNLKTAIKVYAAAYALAAGSNAYHGYKRNGDNIGYGALWLFLGGFVGVGQSIAQGYAKNIN